MALGYVETNVLFSLALAALLLPVAALVYGVAPRSWAARLLAIHLLLLAALQFTSLGGLLLAPTPPALLNPFYTTFVDLYVLADLAAVAALAFYPRAIRVRSLDGALLLAGAALFAANALVWFFAREAVHDFPDNSGGLLALLATHVFRRVGMILMVVSVLVRAKALPVVERRGASLVALALSTFLFVGAGSTYSWEAFIVITSDPRLLVGSWLSVPNDCCYVAPMAFYVAAQLVPTALALWWWRRESFSPVLAVMAVGAFVAAPLAILGNDYWLAPAILTALLLLVAISRHGAFGARELKPAVAALVGVTTAAAVFLLVVAAALGAIGDNTLALVLGTMLGLGAGGAAAIGVVPRGRLAAIAADTTREAPAASAERLGAYRAALERELSEGRSRDAARERLAPLRASLRVTESEHVALEYSLSAARAPAASSALADDAVIGRYRVIRPLGAGGGGATRLCRDERIGRDVVVKTLAGDGDQAEAVLREARAIGAVKHPNVLTVYDAAQSGNDAIIVMEHAEGGSLKDRLARGPLAEDEWRRVARGLLAALEAVHAAGIVHRDVKPSNVLLDAKGEPKLADFGIARLPGLETTVGSLRGAAVGTYRYMSPEQARGRAVTPRSDLYSAALTLHEALTGKPYIEARAGETAAEVQLKAASAGPYAGGAPRALEAWFARALEPEASARFASAAEMRSALEAVVW